MRSAVVDILPPRLRRSLIKFGGDLAVARKKRRLTIAMMTERVGVSKATYLRVEKGDPKVALGIYAMALFSLGFGDVFAELVDQKRDLTGLMLEESQLPRRVRAKKTELAPR
jgi:DNA-binding XRE family transcriptional regulator